MNEVLSNADALSPTIPIVLIDSNGGEMPTRGMAAGLPETEAQLESLFSMSGLQAWTPTPPTRDVQEIEYLRFPSSKLPDYRFRVIDRETVFSGPYHLRRSITRYQLTGETAQ